MAILPVHPPRVDTAVAALNWVTDQIIRSQPGAYVLPHPDGGELWICPYGSGKSAHRVDTGPGTVRVRQFVEVTAPGGATRTYEVFISITEAADECREADDVDAQSGELPVADEPAVPHRPADPAAQSQEP